MNVSDLVSDLKSAPAAPSRRDSGDVTVEIQGDHRERVRDLLVAVFGHPFAGFDEEVLDAHAVAGGQLSEVDTVERLDCLRRLVRNAFYARRRLRRSINPGREFKADNGTNRPVS